MKKTKIIIPALGMLLLSTAASVTGTVAWFTSVSTANADISSFAVRKVGGALDIKVKTAAQNSDNGANDESNTAAPGFYGLTSYGFGTKKASAQSDAVILDNDYDNIPDGKSSSAFLTHASYDHSAKNIYKPSNAGATNFVVDDGADANNLIVGNDADSNILKTYFAVRWTLIFSYTFGGDSTNVNLYFNGAASDGSVVTRNNADAGDLQTYKGFRIGFNCGSRGLVWADHQVDGKACVAASAAGTTYNASTPYYTKSENAGEVKVGYLTDASGFTYQRVESPVAEDLGTYYTITSFGQERCSYIDQAGAAHVANYTNVNSDSAQGNLIDENGLAVPTTDSASANRADYLGTFTVTSTTLVVTCTAWFEGTDPNVVNAATLDNVSAALAFYTRTAA